MKQSNYFRSFYLATTLFSICVVNSLFNAALYKPAFQSSIYKGGVPYLANDGSRRNVFNADLGIYECQHTQGDVPDWWMVDLQGHYVIDQVIVTNRLDEKVPINSLRLRKFQIDVFDTDPRQRGNFLNISGDICYNRTDPVDNGTYAWNCTTPVVGRFLRLIKYSSQSLHICEMEVMTSRFLKRSTSFIAFLNSTLNTPLNVFFTASTSRECICQCLDYTDAKRCTSLEFNLNSKECLLLSIDTRSWKNVTTQLQRIDGVDFYMESDDS